MEDLLDSNIGDVRPKTIRDSCTQPSSKKGNNKIGQLDIGDHKKNSITIIHHQKPVDDPKDLENSTTEEERPLKGECVQRRSTELITAVQSYTQPPDEEVVPASFDLTAAAMTAQLMDMFENEIMYSCSELDALLSEGEELIMPQKPSTSLGHT